MDLQDLDLATEDLKAAAALAAIIAAFRALRFLAFFPCLSSPQRIRTNSEKLIRECKEPLVTPSQN